MRREVSLVCMVLGLVDYVSASCYYPDGSFPSTHAYVPCSGDQFTSCCIPSEGDQCLSNGLCYYPGGQYMFRGACSDKDWNSPNCFNHCTNKTSSYSRTYERIIKCSADRYCCAGGGTSCCNDDTKVFALGNVSVIRDLATTTRRTGGFQALTAAPTGTASTATTNSRATPTGAQTRVNAATASPVTGVSDPISTDATTEVTPAPRPAISKTVIIAASAASTLLIIAIVGGLFFFIRRHYRRKLTPVTFPNNPYHQHGKEHENSYPMSPGEGFQKVPDKSPAVTAAPVYSPAPPVYQSPVMQSGSGHGPTAGGYTPPAVHGAVEMEGYAVPTKNQYGQPVFEAPAVPYRGA